MDRVPRQLNREQLDSLRVLSRQVMAQVVLEKNLHDLKNALQTREDLERDLQKLIQDFQEARTMINTLKGLIPVCARCKKVRNDRGYWEQVEAYIANSTGIGTTSCICPECLQKHPGDAPPAGEDETG